MFIENMYKITGILIVSTVLYLSTVTYNSKQKKSQFEILVVTDFVPEEKLFTNYTFYGEEKPKLECWSDNNCTDNIIRDDILKRLPKSMRDQVEPTLVKTGE